MTLPYYDHERPYQDSCSREERFQDLVGREREEVLEHLSDSQMAEQFISDHIADPNALLADIISYVCQGLQGGEMKKKLTNATIELKIEELVDAESVRRAEKIYDN